MKRQYAIPVAIVALAGTTACTDPLVADWALTGAIVEGSVQELEYSETRLGTVYDTSFVGTLEITDGMQAKLEMDVTYAMTYANGDTEAVEYSYAHEGQVTPGAGKGLYEINLDDLGHFDCTLSNRSTELNCVDTDAEIELQFDS